MEHFGTHKGKMTEKEIISTPSNVKYESLYGEFKVNKLIYGIFVNLF